MERNKNHLKISLEVIKCGTRVNIIVFGLLQQDFHNFVCSCPPLELVRFACRKHNDNKNIWYGRLVRAFCLHTKSNRWTYVNVGNDVSNRFVAKIIILRKCDRFLHLSPHEMNALQQMTWYHHKTSYTILWSISRCTITFINTVDQKFGLVLSKNQRF